MTFDIHKTLLSVSINRCIFHSEADFQHAFAWELHRQFPDASIRLEKPVATKEGVAHLDILVQIGNALIAIELKYKSSKFSALVDGETYNLRNHGAQDLGRYDFVKDIRRLESIAEAHPGAIGYAVLLTNESSYWKPPISENTVDAPFRLHDGRVLSGVADWGIGASDGTKKLREKPISLRASYPLESGRVYSPPLWGAPLQAKRSEPYASCPLDTPPLWGGVVHWRDFSSVQTGNGSVFRYLAVPVV